MQDLLIRELALTYFAFEKGWQSEMTQMHTKIPEDSHLYARFFLVFPLPQEDKATADGNEATSENIGDVAIWQVTKQLKHIAYEVSN